MFFEFQSTINVQNDDESNEQTEKEEHSKPSASITESSTDKESKESDADTNAEELASANDV